MLKPAAFALLSVPFVYLLWQLGGEIAAPGSRLGADPGEAVVHYLGEWSLWLLLATLAVTSSSRWLRKPQLIGIRRMTGLFAFTFVCLHFLAYLGFLAAFDWRLIAEDLSERRYITVGFAALVLLIPLAVTSTRGWRRRLGSRWKTLHRAIYFATALALLHLFWLTRDDYTEPALLLGVFVLLLLERFSARRTRRRAAVQTR